MTGVVPETSALPPPAHSQAGRGRSASGAGQAAGPFSQLLGSSDPALDTATPERPAADRARSKPSPRNDKAPAKRQRADGPAKPAKSTPAVDAKDAKKADAATAPGDAEKTAETDDEGTELQADIAAKTDIKWEVAASGTEPEPSLLTAGFPALDTSNSATTTQAALLPVPTPAPPPPASIPSASAAAGTDAVMKVAAPAVEVAVAAPAPIAAPSISAKPTAEALAAAETADATQPAAPFKQPSAPFKEAGGAEPKTETTGKVEAAVTPAPQADAASIHHATPASKGPEAAAESSESKAPGARADIQPPASAADANAERSGPETASNSNPLPAPSAVTAPAAVHGAQAPATSAAHVAPAAAVPIAGLAIEIAARAHSGKNRFEIRLDPPELGRIDVRLDVDRDGNVTSRLVVDRSETLDLLRRDASNLERALQQAGLKTSDNGLQFSLRDQAFSGRDNGEQAQTMARLVVPEDKLVAVELQRNHGRLAGLGSGVDIRV